MRAAYESNSRNTYPLSFFKENRHDRPDVRGRESLVLQVGIESGNRQMASPVGNVRYHDTALKGSL